MSLQSSACLHQTLSAKHSYDPPETVPVDDDYDEMEAWFGSSLPAEVSVVADGPCAGGSEQDTLDDSSGATFGGLEEQDPGSQDTSPAELGVTEESDLDKYEIDLGPSESSGAYDEQPLEGSPIGGNREHSMTAAVQSAWTSTIALEQEDVPDLVADSVAIQTKVFKRRQRENEMDAPSTSVLSGCDRCKSNLNGKLIACCASCSFRRHLYCFAPPLKQHPTFQEQPPLVTAQGKKVRVRPSADAIARWNCDECRQKLFVNQAPEDLKYQRHHPRTSADRVTTAKANQNLPRSKDELQRSPAKHHHTSVNPIQRTVIPHLTSERNGSEENLLSPVQDKWRRASKSEFDWYAFRVEKAQRIVSQRENYKSDELVYYSKPFAELKRTALSWMGRVEQQKSLTRL